MLGYASDWIGAVGAGLSVLVASRVAEAVAGRRGGPTFYLVLAVGTFVLTLALRTGLRRFAGV